MRRWIPVVLALAGLVGVVGSAAAASGPGPVGPAPAKTTVPPIGGVPAPPTAPPTSAWVTTAPTSPPTSAATGALPTAAPVATSAIPPGAAPTAGFDGLTFLTNVYAAVNSDPLTIIDVAEGTTIINSPADLWLAHLLTVSMTNLVHQGPLTPTYTVSAAGKGVSVCADTGTCEVFGDFSAPTGLLESFTIDGVVIEDAMSMSSRQIVVESLIVDSTLCLKSADGSLSCSMFLTSEGASAALMFEQATFTALDGQQFLPDLNVSAFAMSIADGDFGTAHLVFAGAPLEGELTIPVISGVSGTPSTAIVPVRTS